MIRVIANGYKNPQIKSRIFWLIVATYSSCVCVTEFCELSCCLTRKTRELDEEVCIDAHGISVYIIIHRVLTHEKFE